MRRSVLLLLAPSALLLQGLVQAREVLPRGCPLPLMIEAPSELHEQFDDLNAEADALDYDHLAYQEKCLTGSKIPRDCATDQADLTKRDKVYAEHHARYQDALLQLYANQLSQVDHTLEARHQEIGALAHSPHDVSPDLDEWINRTPADRARLQLIAFFNAVGVAAREGAARTDDSLELSSAQREHLQHWSISNKTMPHAVHLSTLATRKDLRHLIALMAEAGRRVSDPVEAAATAELTRGLIQVDLESSREDVDLHFAWLTAQSFLMESYSGWANHIDWTHIHDFSDIVGGNGTAINAVASAYNRTLEHRQSLQRDLDQLKASSCFTP